MKKEWKIEKEGRPTFIIDYQPSKTIKAYKLVHIGKDSNSQHCVYPLYVNFKDEKWLMEQWYGAGRGSLFAEYDSNGNKTGKYKVKSKLGFLSYRPGIHLSSLPFAPHIYSKKPNFSDEKKISDFKNYDFSLTRFLKKNTMWAECEINANNDYTEEALKNGRKISDGNETFVAYKACLHESPNNGFYRYRTNINAPSYETWYITAAFKINKILSDEEVTTILKANGIKNMERKK